MERVVARACRRLRQHATLPPGVYIRDRLDIGAAGVLTLRQRGDSDARFVFRAPSALTSGRRAGHPAAVVLINAPRLPTSCGRLAVQRPLNVRSIPGNVLADTSVRLGTSASSPQITGGQLRPVVCLRRHNVVSCRAMQCTCQLPLKTWVIQRESWTSYMRKHHSPLIEPATAGDFELMALDEFRRVIFEKNMKRQLEQAVPWVLWGAPPPAHRY